MVVEKTLANLANPEQFAKVLPVQIYIIKLWIDYDYREKIHRALAKRVRCQSRSLNTSIQSCEVEAVSPRSNSYSEYKGCQPS